MKPLVLCAIVGGAIAAAVACGGAGGGTLDCAKMCEKDKECATASKPYDDATCQTECEQTKELVQGVFQEAIMTCLDKSCSEQSACLDEGAKDCEKPADFDDFVNSLCTKTVQCGIGGITLAQCTSLADGALSQSGGQTLVCLTDAAVSTLSTCLESVQCPTFQADYQKCVAAALGLDVTATGGSSSSHNDGGI